jgi:hypothetical protein
MNLAREFAYAGGEAGISRLMQKGLPEPAGGAEAGSGKT